MYSTWFSASPRGYCDRNFLLGCASGLYLRGADSDECWEETPLEGVFEVELGSDVRSIMGGLGDLDGLEFLDMAEGEREDGKEDREVRRLLLANGLPFEVLERVLERVLNRGSEVILFVMATDEVSLVEVVPRVDGRCCWSFCISAIFFLVSRVVR